MLSAAPRRGRDRRPRALPRAVMGLAFGVVMLLTTPLPSLGQSDGSGPTGRIAGSVIDADTGRPLGLATVRVDGADASVVTDVQGRFRTKSIPVGTYQLVVQLLGYTTVEQSVNVAAGETAVVTIPLGAQALSIEGIVIETDRTETTSSTVGLLAQRRSASAISDGVSAEQISASPDSDAGEAVRRVTGVSVVDDQFVVVRGLGERYSTTTLNGAEVASPEPTKRIVPLNIFPASLLESVVTSKTATADKPGDFAGGLVEVRTKEFPEQRVFELSLSTDFNDLSTFRKLPIFAPRGLDFVGLDGKDRDPGPVSTDERFAESIRNEWSPPPRTVPPNTKIEFSYGNQFGSFERALGLVVSGLWSNGVSWSPDNLFGLAQDSTFSQRQLSDQASRETDLGGTANLSLRLGPSHTLSLKNLATRNVEEFSSRRVALVIEAGGGEFTDEAVGQQVRYTERTFLQSQLGGTHLLPGLANSRLEWAATIGRADREEPENRSLTYLILADGSGQLFNPNNLNQFFWFRDLKDEVYTGKVDYHIPVGTAGGGEGLAKFGGYYRTKRRDVDATSVKLGRTGVFLTNDPVFGLPPEQLWSPENVGDVITLENPTSGAIPYEAKDDLAAAYGMVDLRFGPIRMVAGARAEKWDLRVDDATGEPTIRDELDILGSANVTWSVTDRMNVRAAGYQTLARPDAREVTETLYIGTTGECNELGNPSLNRTRIVNADLRWEWFPSASEIVSISGFYKRFDDPIIMLVRVQSQSCGFVPRNADTADNLGLEFEFRKQLGFLAESLSPWTLGANFTLVSGAVRTKRNVDFEVEGELPLQDQSDYLVNANLGYANPEAGFDFSVFYNLFTDRARRYGLLISTTRPELGRTPDVFEQGRSTVDAKLRKTLRERWTLSLSGSNLTGADQVRFQELDDGTRVRVGFIDLPVSLGLGLKYTF